VISELADSNQRPVPPSPSLLASIRLPGFTGPRNYGGVFSQLPCLGFTSVVQFLSPLHSLSGDSKDKENTRLHLRRSGWFAENARWLSVKLILVVIVCEIGILVASVVSPGPAAECSAYFAQCSG
jgi:hypothetical protein